MGAVAFWGVIVGGLLTIGGQVAAELLKSRVASKERQDRRDAIAREYRRQAAARLAEAAVAYQHALVENERSPASSPAIEDQLRATRTAFQSALYRVDSQDCRGRFIAWEKAAVSWSNDEGPHINETSTWQKAVEAAGAAERDTL
jgi:hypothetical protein